MGRKLENNCLTVGPVDWPDFVEAILQADRPENYLWRGQRDPEWPVESSIDRLLNSCREQSPGDLRYHSRNWRPVLAAKHLNAFRAAIRGRRGVNPPRLTPDQEWALGRHYGLATPLLDWTRFPFVAAFFAFDEQWPSGERGRTRAIYALNKNVVDGAIDNIVDGEDTTAASRIGVIDVVTPYSDDNVRLISQGGVFTKMPLGKDLETWVREIESFTPYSKHKNALEWPRSGAALTKFLLPDSERQSVIKGLRQMHISHGSLMPDLHGAALQANLELEFGDRDGGFMFTQPDYDPY